MKIRRNIEGIPFFASFLLGLGLFCLLPSPFFAQVVPSDGGSVFPTAAENPGWLGVGLREMTEDERNIYGVNHPGVMIKQVFDGTPAKTTGFLVGDYVISVGHHPITKGVREMVAHVKSNPEGSKVFFEIIRNGKKKTLTAKLGVVPKRGQLIKNAWLNKEMPPISVMELDGKTAIDFGDYRGKIVFIDYCNLNI